MAAINNQIIPKNIEAIFFDLYGTLLIYGDMNQAWNDWFLSVYDSFRKYGMSQTKDQFAVICDNFFERPEPQIADDGFTVFERRVHRLASETNLNLQVSEIKQTVVSAVQAWHQYITVDPETHSTLQKLRQNKRLGLITNFDHPPYIYSLLSEEKLDDFFELITISGEIGFKKPDPRIFGQTLEKVDIRPEQVIYVGDTDSDITGAKKAGIIPILIQREKSETNRNALDFHSENNNMDKFDKKSSVYTDAIIIRRLSELPNILS
jgi:putative hydrolase of the HAD superfamily